MTTGYVTCPGSAGTRFERHDYVQRHSPLVMKWWGQLGLERGAALWPAEIDPRTTRIAIAGVMVDVIGITDNRPPEGLRFRSLAQLAVSNKT